MRPWLAAFVFAPVMACGGSSGLSGSLGDAYRLDFSSVRARLYDSELAIEYVTNREAVPVRVTVRTDEVDLRPGGRYDLGAVGDVSGRQIDGSEMPEFQGGALELDEYQARNGGAISGSFDARLVAGTDTLTLEGTFDTTLEIVGDDLRN